MNNNKDFCAICPAYQPLGHILHLLDMPRITAIHFWLALMYIVIFKDYFLFFMLCILIRL